MIEGEAEEETMADDQLDEHFVQLGPRGQVTMYACLHCGAAVAVAELHDARAQHLEYHDTHKRLIVEQSDASKEVARVLGNHDQMLKEATRRRPP
jgi:hypothetical protein